MVVTLVTANTMKMKAKSDNSFLRNRKAEATSAMCDRKSRT